VNLTEGEPPGRWPISHINGEAQEQDYHDWPFIESTDAPDEGLNRVLWADGYGLAIVNNPYMNQSMILSLVDWRNPIRIPQGCPAEDLTMDASVEATARASSAHNAIDDDPATNWPIWGSTESSLTIDLGSAQTFKFISIRYSSSSSFSRIEEITIETSSNGTDFTPILTRDVHSWLRKGVDIEIPHQTARYVRLRFNCEGIQVRINEVEICRYAPLLAVVSPESRRDLDPYEINDTVSQAMPIVPGVLSDPSIHGLDDIDYFEVDLLAGNTIQAMIEYDLIMSLNIEVWGISYGTPDPVLLASGTGEEIDGNNITRFAEWTADASPWQCYIRILPVTGIIGNYTLTIQTRGPELVPDSREDREVVWEYPVHLSPEPDPVTRIPTAELTGRNIHTGGPWNTWRPYWGEVDYFSVIGQRGYDVRVTITPTDPDAGQPHAFPREDPRISRFIDNRSDWPNSQVLIIRPTYGDAPSMRVCFGVKGSHNENYRKDTGGYNLKVELTYAIPDMAVIEGFYSAADSIEDDLAEYFELPEIPMMLELGVNYEFEAPPRPGDPYLMHLQSKTTGETIYSYELDSSLFSSPEEFIEAADYFMEIHSPVSELTMPGR
jgi:hypothetical protein